MNDIVVLDPRQFADLMMALGFGFGCLFWAFVYFLIFGRDK